MSEQTGIPAAFPAMSHRQLSKAPNHPYGANACRVACFIFWNSRSRSRGVLAEGEYAELFQGRDRHGHVTAVADRAHALPGPRPCGRAARAYGSASADAAGVSTGGVPRALTRRGRKGVMTPVISNTEILISVIFMIFPGFLAGGAVGETAIV